MVFLVAMAVAVTSVTMLASLAAREVAEGEEVVALFPHGLSAAAVIQGIDRSGARQFEPLRFGNAWRIQAGSGTDLGAALKDEGAIMVLKAGGPLHFALGCTVAAPLPKTPL